MKKLSILFLALLFVACDEGITISIPVSSTYSFTMPSAEVNAQDDNLFSVSETVDVTQLVDEDADAIESIKLNKLTYQVSGYDNTSGNVVTMEFKIQTRINGNVTDILVVSDLPVANSGQLVAFEDGSATSQLTSAQVASLETIMDNKTPFELIVSGDFSGDIDSDFDISVTWDIEASVTQDTGE